MGNDQITIRSPNFLDMLFIIKVFKINLIANAPNTIRENSLIPLK